MKPLLRRLLLWVALPILLVALAVWSWTPREPSWEGRALSSWLKDLEPERKERLGAVGEQNAAAAERAIQGMGTNCLPFLLRQIEYFRPNLPQGLLLFLAARLSEHGVPLEGVIYDPGRHARAAFQAFKVLGHQAAPIVPELERWLVSSDKAKQSSAAELLSGIHPEGIAALVIASTNRTLPSQSYVMGALVTAAYRNPEALAFFIGRANEPDSAVRAHAALVLRLYPKDAAVIVPVLARLLVDTESSVRRSALNSLSVFKTDIRAAETAVTTLTTDPDPEISSRAEVLLLKIKAQSATPPPAP